MVFLSRKSSRVLNRAAFLSEPLRLRVRRCCKALDMALLPPRRLALKSSPSGRSRPEWLLSGVFCVAWIIRRKESLESKEPEELRLCPLLALPERVRPAS